MNQLKAGVILSYITIALQIVIALSYTPYMLRMLGQSEFGLYSLAASIVAYLTVLDLGFGNAAIRYTANFKAKNMMREMEEMFGMFFIIYVIIGLFTLVAGVVLAANVENLFDRAMTPNEVERTRIMLWLLVANLAFTFPMSVWGSIISAYERFFFLKGVSVIRSVANPLVMVVLLAVGYKAVAMVVVITTFNVATLLLNWWYCKHRLHIRLRFARFQWGFLKEVMLFSFWSFLVIIMDRIYWSTGQFVLGIVRGTAAVAIYALAVQLQNMFITFSSAFSTILLPRITSLVAKGESEKEISDIFIKTGRIQYIILAFILSGFIIFGQDFINLWAGSNYSRTYLICLIFFIPMTVDLIQNMGLVILQARNQLRFRGTLCIILGINCFTLSFPFAIWWGEIGCAFAVAVSLVAGQIIAMNIYYYRRQAIDIPRFWREIGKMSMAPVCLTVVSVTILHLLNIRIESFGKLILLGMVYCLIYIPVFWKLGMNSYEKELLMTPVRRFLRPNVK